jgi:hypothetical protein
VRVATLWRRALVVLGAAGVLVGASPAEAQVPPGAKMDYRGTGVVLALLPPPSSLHATRPVIVIEHEPIAGLMDEKMSMPFLAASTALFQGLRPGDRIA